MSKAYEKITDTVLKLLDQGVVPWRRTWAGGCPGLPKSFSSRKVYRGINPFLLDCAAMLLGFSSRYWVTYRQAGKLGGQVRKGEHGQTVVFWKWLELEDRDNPGAQKRVPFLRFFTVFNLDQVDGLTAPADDTVDPVVPGEFSPIDAAAAVVADMPKRPKIAHDVQRAFYRATDDLVNMPKPETFESADHYYSVLFHELTHSTGAEHRLNRKGDQLPWAAFGSDSYGKEELIAEFGAAFLSGEAGIVAGTVDNSASYIDNWRRKIKGDRKLVVLAAAAAQRAADFILGRQYGDKAVQS